MFILGSSNIHSRVFHAHLSQNQYIRLHNSSGLEVVHHALLYFQYTGDTGFVRDTLLPLAEAVIDYYDTGFPRMDRKLHITPAQVIEQWWEAENPWMWSTAPGTTRAWTGRRMWRQ